MAPISRVRQGYERPQTPGQTDGTNCPELSGRTFTRCTGGVSTRAVIFDLGQVILQWIPERALESVLPPDEIAAFFDRVGFFAWNSKLDGGGSFAEAEEKLAEQFPADRELILTYRRNFVRTVPAYVPGTLAIVATLRQHGIRVEALTNWAEETFNLVRDDFGGLKLFEDIVVSGTERVMKPDHTIYDIACRRLGVAPQDAIFIDDSPVNAGAATAFGMTGLVFTDAAQLREELAARGLPVPSAPAEPIFHLTTRELWDAARAAGEYRWSTRGVPLTATGFVHCSFSGQLAGVREEHFSDVAEADLVVLQLPSTDFVVIEDGYPHVYEPLPVDDVVQASWPA